VLPSSRLLFTLDISENPGIKIELNTLLGKKQHFANHFFMNSYRYKLPLYTDGDQLGHYRLSYFDTGYGIHYNPGLNHQLGINLYYKHNVVKPQPDLQNIYEQAAFDKHLTHDLGYEFFYSVNTTDDLYFATRGINLKLFFAHNLASRSELDELIPRMDFEYFISERSGAYATLMIDHNWYKSFGDFTYNFGVSGGLNSNNPGITGYFMLGGERFGNRNAYRNFAGFNLAEIYTPNFAMVRSNFRVQVLNGLYLSGTLNVGVTGETYEDLFSEITDNPLPEYIWGYTAGVKYDSLIGPIQLLMAGNNKDNKTRFQLSVGFPF
jgi:NTE family protein